MVRKKPSSKAVEARSPRRRLGVVVVDPLPVVRAGLGMLVDASPDLEVLAHAGDADDVLEVLEGIQRSGVVVLVGLGVNGAMDAAALIREVRERHPSHAVLAMGANADAGSVSRVLFVGADGYVDKNTEPEDFLEAIRRAGEREMVLAGPASGSVGEIAATMDRRRQLDIRLTERERQVLAVAAEGLTARQIAARLGVRERTVTTHLARIYGKLGVTNRLAAIRTAARSGYVSVGGSE